MGLFDYDGLTDDPRQQGLLSLGLRLMSTPGKFGQAFGQAGLGAMGDMKAAKRGLLEAEFKRAQMSEMQSQEEQRRALARKAVQEAEMALQKQQMQDRQDTEFRRDLNPAAISGGQAAGMPGGMSPQNAAMVGTASPRDWAALASKWPGKVDQLEKLSKAGDWGMPEVARTMDVEGPVGEKLVRSVDKRGRQVGADQTGYIAPVPVNTGASTEFRKPTAGLSVPSFMSPGERARLEQSRVTERRLAASDKRTQNKEDADSKDPGKYTQVVIDPNLGPIVVDRKTNKWTPVVSDGGARIPGKNVTDAKQEEGRLGVAIADARKLIPKATGSGAGSLVDTATRFVGQGTEGDDASTQLETLAGWMTSNVPRMQGPQSDKDVLLYKQMAAQVGDRTKTRGSRLKALDTLEGLQKKYATLDNPSSNAAAPSGVDAEDWKHMTPQERSLWKK